VLPRKQDELPNPLGKLMHNLSPISSPGKTSAPRKGSPELTGVFPRARWRRRGAFESDAPRTPYQSARAELARLDTAAILDRHAAISQHTHARWSARDRATHDELVARSWGVNEISSLKMVGLPRWVEPLLHRVSPTGRRMSRPGWRAFLGLVLGAFRGGAAGLRLTYDELTSEAVGSIATAKRYVPEMIEAGLITRIKVSREVTGGKINRANDCNIYQPGPVMLANWHALLEGCSSRVPSGGPSAARATFAAHELRQDAKEYRRQKELAARASHPSPGLPGRLRRPDIDGHESDDQGHNADSLAARCRASKPAPAPAPTPAELDAIDAELAQLSAKRSSVGAALDLEPGALATGRAPAGAAHDVSRPKYQGGLTTRSRSKDRDPSGPEGPRPVASAPGENSKAAPTLERFALCWGLRGSEAGKGSRCSHSADDGHREPRPLASAHGMPTPAPQNPSNKAPASGAAGLPLGVAPPAPQPQAQLDAPRRTFRGDDPRVTILEDEGAPPSTGANYDWRRGLREHVERGGSLRFLDPRLRAELGFDEDES